MSDNKTQSIEELLTSTIDSAYTQFESAWEVLIGDSPATDQLRSLPSNLHATVSDLYSKITQGGTLPTLDEVRTSVNWAPAPAPPPPPPPPARLISRERASNVLRNHPYLIALLTTSTVAGTAYYLRPKQTLALVRPLGARIERLLPLAILPKSNRPLRLSTPSGEVRKEAVLVLGAEGILAELALDLERRGFVVIATARDSAQAEALERRGAGFLKTLVLDPSDSSSVQPFLRSLSTALSLRFPLHSVGDPFARPSHALALTSVVNGLTFDQPHAVSAGALRPVEGLSVEDVRREVGERVASLVGVLQGVLPVLRTAAGRPGAPQGTIVSLYPASTASVNLPFLSLSSATASASQALLASLKRELDLTRHSNLRITSVNLGRFNLPADLSLGSAPDSLPARLSSVYGSALGRSAWLAPVSGGRRAKTPVQKLGRKVFEVVVRGRGGRETAVGGGAFTYRFLSWLPHAIVDSILSLHDRFAQLALAHQARFGSVAFAPRAARALPTPPTGAHPDALRPGYAPPPPNGTNTPQNGLEELADSSEEDGVSSIEDFGLDQSGMGSFVNVDGQAQGQ